MKNLLKCYGIIPARYHSTRFPGKPLVDILGKPMFWHVFNRASQCPDLLKVILATDDDRIISAAEKLDVPVVMTRDDHASGTDRVLEAATMLKLTEEAVVVNIQCDEPTLHPSMLTALVRPFVSPEIQVSTLAHKVDQAETQSPDRVNVVLSKSGKGLYFSRSIIPYPRNDHKFPFLEHVGLYAYRMHILKKFVALGPSLLERIEKLEMLRLLENDIPIHVEITDYPSVSVDNPQDLERAIKFFTEQPASRL